MGQNTEEQALERREAVTKALEAARLEVVDRMAQKQLPLSVAIPELRIIDSDSGGSRSEWTVVQQSGLRDFTVQQLIEDSSVSYRPLGLRPQLEPLADLLDRTTDLGTRPGNFLPAMSGVEAILARYVTTLAYEYLANLPDLSQADSELIDRLASELEELIAPDVALNTSQVALAGVLVKAPLEYREVKLCQLSPGERGQYFQSRNNDFLFPMRRSGRFVIPRDFAFVIPSMLLEVTTSRPRTELFNQSALMNRVALAFYLLGYHIASPGIAVSFDRPTWATLGQSHQRFLVDEKPIANTRLVSEEEFHSVVDLAYQMPDFGASESTSQEIALYRMLRGLGMHWQESGFLDFVIALEAALLRDVETTELSYRFALYGSLFLGGVLDPRQTFAKLRNIYDVRSKLVHGSAIKPAKRQQAVDDAPELAKAVFLKAIQQGWPAKKELDELALTVKT